MAKPEELQQRRDRRGRERDRTSCSLTSWTPDLAGRAVTAHSLGLS